MSIPVASVSLIAIGNALVDLEFSISEAVLTSSNIPKSTMQLASLQEQNALLNQLSQDGSTPRKQSSGGSAANTATAFTALGGSCYYIGRVGDDALGRFYLNDLNNIGIQTQPHALSEGQTGTCVVLNTPDGERTMQTHLGISAALSKAQLGDIPLDSHYLYIEGYLASSPTAIEAVKQLRQQTLHHQHHKIAMSLSDCSMIQFFKSGLLALLGDGVDILFCNEQEALAFSEQPDLEHAINLLHHISHLVVVTRGPQGAVVSERHKHTIYADGKSILVRDTNGAGDAFAGAFLYGLNQQHSLVQCALLANEIAAAVVGTLGARLEPARYAAIKQQLIR